MGCPKPPPLVEHNGDILSIPNSVIAIAKLPVYRLQEILRFHNVLDCGTKDELVVRVGMVKGGRSYLAFHMELEAIRNVIVATSTITMEERDLFFEDPTVQEEKVCPTIRSLNDDNVIQR